MVARILWPYALVIAVTAAALSFAAGLGWSTGGSYTFACAVLIPVTVALLAFTNGLGTREKAPRLSPSSVTSADLRFAAAASATGADLRVATLACAVAERIGLSPAESALAHDAALVRNVGNRFLPDALLEKAGRLTAAEFEVVKRHPMLGQDRLGAQHAAVGLIVRSTHERWDGLGYPDGLAGTGIPVEARIVAVADAFVAMTSPRPYRSRPLTEPEAAAELRHGAGTQFDPNVVHALLEVVGRAQPEDATHASQLAASAAPALSRPASLALVARHD